MTDLRQDDKVNSKKDDYAWVVPAHRRLAQFLVPLNFTFARDHFHCVRSDGEKFIAATGAQHSEAYPHDEYLYVIDGKSGKLMFVVPTTGFAYNRFFLTANYVGCVVTRYARDASSTATYLILIWSLPDGKIVLKSDCSDLGLDQVLSMSIAENMVRIQGQKQPRGHPPTSREVFIELPSGKPLSKEEANKRIDALASQGVVQKRDPWRLYEAHPMFIPKSARCRNLDIRIEGNSWLVAIRDKDE